MASKVALCCMIWLVSASTWNSCNAQQEIGRLISRNKPATQSSLFTWYGVQMPASFANDGNYMQRIGRTHATIKCAHTQGSGQPWWRVDLQSFYDISQVKIWNRVDCCSDRLVPMVIEVSSDDTTWQQCASLNSLASGIAGVFTLACNATGRYVRLSVKKTTYLNVCEIEVYAVPIHGNWGSWGHWSSCAANGNSISRSRLRECNNPAPANGGDTCSGDNSEVSICVHGNWGDWGAWSLCALNGSIISRSRLRECNNPAPANGGDNCAGDSNEVSICVHGNWGSWGTWSTCAANGNSISRSRLRECNNPAPANGGDTCPGNSSEVSICVHGNWGDWGAWSPCALNGSSIISQSRLRECNNPVPANGGDTCAGDSSELSICGTGDVISRNKPATQSSLFTWYGVQMPASFANDGNYMQRIGRTHATIKCAHTQGSGQPWWRVDLQAFYDISQVKIWNRVDCCSDRLVPMVIEVSSDDTTWQQCASLNNLSSGIAGVFTLPCNARGRYVRLSVKKTTYLNVCEIEVYGFPN